MISFVHNAIFINLNKICPIYIEILKKVCFIYNMIERVLYRFIYLN